LAVGFIYRYSTFMHLELTAIRDCLAQGDIFEVGLKRLALSDWLMFLATSAGTTKLFRIPA
jgi:hypothetical protein